VVLTGELLAQAESLLKMGLHPSDVIRGFEKAGDEAHTILEGITLYTISIF
jgi:T-complex protein 1 subunit theta